MIEKDEVNKDTVGAAIKPVPSDAKLDSSFTLDEGVVEIVGSGSKEADKRNVPSCSRFISTPHFVKGRVQAFVVKEETSETKKVVDLTSDNDENVGGDEEAATGVCLRGNIKVVTIVTNIFHLGAKRAREADMMAERFLGGFFKKSKVEDAREAHDDDTAKSGEDDKETGTNKGNIHFIHFFHVGIMIND